MNTLHSRIVRTLSSDAVTVRHPPQDLIENNDNAFHGYYSLLPMARTKPNRIPIGTHRLCAFGPYRSALEARFINTSALALGLLESAR